MDTHVKVVAVLLIAFSLLGLFIGLTVFGVLVTGGLISGDETAMLATGAIGTFVGGIIAVLSIPGFIAGIGLFSYKSWAWYVTVIISILNLINIPFGTALGAYALWVMFHQDTKVLFGMSNPAPPAPQSPAT